MTPPQGTQRPEQPWTVEFRTEKEFVLALQQYHTELNAFCDSQALRVAELESDRDALKSANKDLQDWFDNLKHDYDSAKARIKELEEALSVFFEETKYLQTADEEYMDRIGPFVELRMAYTSSSTPSSDEVKVDPNDKAPAQIEEKEEGR